jgi:adenine deaminase
MRRLNLDAAKVMKYGGVPEEDALKMITWNPAWQLGIEKRTGSIEIGKDADIVIWNVHPFSVYSHADMTLVEGEVLFDRAKDIANRAALETERQALEKLEVNRAPGQGQPSTAPAIPRERKKADLDDAEEGDNDNE